MSDLKDFITKLEAEAKAEEVKIVAVAEHFVSDIISGAEAIGRGVEADLVSLAPTVLSLVLGEAPKVLSGEEKFGNAVAGLIQLVEGRGESILLQTAHMAVQAAYVAAKAIAADLP